MRHQRCGSTVYIDVNSCFNVLAEFSTAPSEGVIQTTRIHVFQSAKSIHTLNYQCTNCDISVTLDDLVSNCRGCGNHYSLNEIFVPAESNGSFCEECFADMYSEEERTALADLLTDTQLFII